MKTSILIALALVSSTSAIKIDENAAGFGGRVKSFIKEHNFDQTKEQGPVGDFMDHHDLVQDKAAGFGRVRDFIKEHNFVQDKAAGVIGGFMDKHGLVQEKAK